MCYFDGKEKHDGVKIIVKFALHVEHLKTKSTTLSHPFFLVLIDLRILILLTKKFLLILLPMIMAFLK